jgi:spore maturation protein CgeB
VFEVVRVSYLLANGRFVVSERGGDAAEDDEFAAGVVFADYGELVDACVAYLGRPDERRRIAQAGFELMVRRDLREYLRGVLDEA